MHPLQLVSFALAMAALVVCGLVFTRKPRKKLPTETLRPAMPDERQSGCFALEDEKGVNWKGARDVAVDNLSRGHLFDT